MIMQEIQSKFYIEEKDGKITQLRYLPESESARNVSSECLAPSFLVLQAEQQLYEYFKGLRKEFDLPLNPQGTVFQKKVWKALQEIPYGEVRTYGQIAGAVGSPKGARAVGMACHNNPILIMIPCHRVIGANGSLTGFGCGLDMKEKLLKLESTIKPEAT